MQIGSGALTACATYHLMFLREPKRVAGDLAVFLIGTLLLSAASLFAMVLAALFYLALAVHVWMKADFRTELIRNRQVWWLIAGFAIPFTCLAGYFLWTLTLGAKASGVGGTGILNLAFAMYELAGLNGLGPDRNSIRESMLVAFRPYLAPLVVGLLAYAGLFVVAWRNVCATDREYMDPLLAGLALFFGGCVVAFLVGTLGGFRLLGRHLTPIFPMLLMLVAAFIVVSWRSKAGRVVVVLFLVVMMASSLNLRFNPRFAKDDYRGAATIAQQVLDEGKAVWWAADGVGARYYGIEPSLWIEGTMAPAQSGIFYANSRESDYLSRLPEPSVVILSKEDIYDRKGALGEWLGARGWTVVERLPGFTVWRPRDGGQ
ncbi:MAG: hypothetical protein SNJ84_08370, partial [Verrucomicrobiia bacterium]